MPVKIDECVFYKQPPSGDAPAVDTAEQVYISSLALLKVSALVIFCIVSSFNDWCPNSMSMYCWFIALNNLSLSFDGVEQSLLKINKTTACIVHSALLRRVKSLNN